MVRCALVVYLFIFVFSRAARFVCQIADVGRKLGCWGVQCVLLGRIGRPLAQVKARAQLSRLKFVHAYQPTTIAGQRASDFGSTLLVLTLLHIPIPFVKRRRLVC